MGLYAKLGDIEFKGLLGFDSLTDKRVTTYAQHPLLNGKPVLDPTGEELTEFTVGVTLHVAFCNPEDIYAQLNDYRANRTVLPFVYGTGFIEGEFVITNIDRTWNQTDDLGNLQWITVSFTLLEFVSANTAKTQQARDKYNAFAISSNRPLPSNPNTQPENPALGVMEENKDISQATDKISDLTDNVNSAVAAANTAPPISLAQKFVDEIPMYTQRATDQANECNTSLTTINNFISLYPNLDTEQPDLVTAVSAAQTVLTALATEFTVLGGLPSTISSVPQANTALAELENLTNIISDLITAVKQLKAANATIARALATKKDLS